MSFPHQQIKPNKSSSSIFFISRNIVSFACVFVFVYYNKNTISIKDFSTFRKYPKRRKDSKILEVFHWQMISHGMVGTGIF